jgi:glycosyltransferase involved in cell wall biosynthesis
VPKKGLDILLRALAALPSDLAWRFVHIGAGGEQDALSTLAAQLGIERRCTWKGSMDQQGVLEEYRMADLFALACRVTDDGDRDGLPNVLVEAASQQLAVVSTTISAIPELFVDGVSGLLVPPEDVPALAEALARAIRDPQLRQRLGRAAEARVRADFDYTSSIRQLTALFGGGTGAP